MTDYDKKYNILLPNCWQLETISMYLFVWTCFKKSILNESNGVSYYEIIEVAVMYIKQDANQRFKQSKA